MPITPDTSVRYFESTMAGAPVLDNQWGSLTALLKACLVTGFGVRSVTSATFADGAVTITTSTPHGYVAGRVVALSGAAEGAYNREWRIASITSATAFTVAVPDGLSLPATASGTMEVKIAPLGWEMPHTKGHKAAFRSTHPEATGNMLLIDSSCPDGYNTNWAKWARVGMVQDMLDIDTPVGAQAPFDATKPQRNWQPAGNNQWGWAYWDWARVSSSNSSGDGGSTPRHWLLVGDGRLFYLCLQLNARNDSAWSKRVSYLFGDIASVRPGDQYHTALIAEVDERGRMDGSYAAMNAGYGLTAAGEYKGHMLLRSYTQTGAAVEWEMRSIPQGSATDVKVSGHGSNRPYPNGADQALWLWPVYVCEAGRHWRGTLPGLYHIDHHLPHADMAVVDNVPGQAGRQLVLPRLTYSSYEAQVALDITGPWR